MNLNQVTLTLNNTINLISVEGLNLCVYDDSDFNDLHRH